MRGYLSWFELHHEYPSAAMRIGGLLSHRNGQGRFSGDQWWPWKGQLKLFRGTTGMRW